LKNKAGGVIIKKEQIRCKKCGKRLFDGSPGWDILTGKAKEQDIICPRCGTMNTITVELEEKVIVRLKE